MRTIPSALAEASRNPKCRGANSTSVTARRASDNVAFDTHREEEEDEEEDVVAAVAVPSLAGW